MDLQQKRAIIAVMMERGRPDLANVVAGVADLDKLEVLAHYNRLLGSNEVLACQVLAARQIVLGLDQGFLSKLASSLKTGVRRIIELFKLPQVVVKLKEILGEISIKSFLDLIKRGKEIAKKLWGQVKDKLWFVVEKGKIPTLTSLVENTELALKVKGIYLEKVAPAVDIIDTWIKNHIPLLGKIALAALFAFIWLNVEEISWEPMDIIRGFAGLLSLREIIASLPESGVGFLLSAIAGGAGFTIMPYILIPRLAWLLAKGFIKWRRGKFEADLPASA